MKKKILTFLILCVLTISLVACGDTKEEKKTEEKEEMNYLVLVNKENKLPDNWENIVQLETTKDIWGDDVQAEKEALFQFFKLKQELESEEIFIELDSAYRSVKRQEELWAEFEKEYGLEYTQKTVAIPGTSEHHTGLAIDVCLRKNGKLIYENADMLKEKKIFAAVHGKLNKYGFILRFPEGKDDKTGYSYEPWHFRYVGSPEIAKKITDSGLTLEEYLEKENQKEVK